MNSSVSSLKSSACQYFIKYKNDSQHIFTTNSQKIISFVQSKAPGQNITEFSKILAGLTEDSVQQIGNFTVVKTKDVGKYIKVE